MARISSTVVWGLVLSPSVLLAAEPTSPVNTAPRAAALAGPAEPAPLPGTTLRREPEGVHGISPLGEAVVRGDGLYLARDFEGALRAYQAGVSRAPQLPLGHLRMAEVLLKLQRLPEAEEALNAALRFSGADAGARARATFLLAVVREAQKPLEKAAEAWARYEKLASEAGTEAASAAPHGASALARRRVVEARLELEAEYARVRARIEKREAEANESMKQSVK